MDTTPYQSERFQQGEVYAGQKFVANASTTKESRCRQDGNGATKKKTPWTIVPHEASCRIVHAFLVTEYIKSKVTRQCDLGQVDFHEKRGENTIDLPEEKASPTEDSTCCARSSRRDSVRQTRMKKVCPSLV